MPRRRQLCASPFCYSSVCARHKRPTSWVPLKWPNICLFGSTSVSNWLNIPSWFVFPSQHRSTAAPQQIAVQSTKSKYDDDIVGFVQTAWICWAAWLVTSIPPLGSSCSARFVSIRIGTAVARDTCVVCWSSASLLSWHHGSLRGGEGIVMLVLMRMHVAMVLEHRVRRARVQRSWIALWVGRSSGGRDRSGSGNSRRVVVHFDQLVLKQTEQLCLIFDEIVFYSKKTNTITLVNRRVTCELVLFSSAIVTCFSSFFLSVWNNTIPFYFVLISSTKVHF